MKAILLHADASGLRRSVITKNPCAAAFSEHFMVFSDYCFLEHPARVVVDRMSEILISPIPAFFARHRDKKTRGTLDDLQVAYHKARITKQ